MWKNGRAVECSRLLICSTYSGTLGSNPSSSEDGNWPNGRATGFGPVCLGSTPRFPKLYADMT